MTSTICASCFCILFTLAFGSASNIGYFWHVADFHVDNNYSVNGNPNYMCWDVSTTTNESVGIYGNYLCDSPQLLVESAVDAMVKYGPEPDFIMWTGDNTPHVNDSFFSTEIVFDYINQTTIAIKEKFPETLVVPVLGNHDTYPQNQISPGESDLQSLVAGLWKDWLDEFDAYDDFFENGSFVAQIPNTTLSILALNTLIWYRNNDFTAENETLDDPGDQFAWLENTLQSMEETGEKAYLMGHIPPGMFERYFDKREGFYWYQPRYNEKYIEIIQKYGESSIAAQIFGHHHTDSFRVFYDVDGNTPISFGLIAPGVTPMKSTLSPDTGANNPGIRLIGYDRETGEIENVTTYYLDLVKANKVEEADWKEEYELKSILNIDRINATTLHEAAISLKTNDTLFEEYYPVNTVQWTNASTCDDACRTVQICAMLEIDYQDYYDCNSAWTSIDDRGVSFITIICLAFLHYHRQIMLSNR